MRNAMGVCGLLALALTLACGNGDEAPADMPATRPDPTGAWRLTTLGEEPAPQPSRITLVITADGKLSGFGGCNRYFSSFETDDAGALSIARLGATRMACSAELIDPEQQFFAALESADTFRVGDGTLEILNDSGAVVLAFTADPGA